MIGMKKRYERLKRGIAFALAVILMVQPFFDMDFSSFPAWAVEEAGSGSTFSYYDSGNLLKQGSSFPFYGKDHNRVGLWPYGITNVEGGKSAPGYCLEPNKSMRSGTSGRLVTYDLDTDGDNLPLGISREEAEILWYALSSSGNFEGYQSNVGKVGQGHYILGQCATWAIMSGNWNGLEDFGNQMEVLMQNLKSESLAVQTRAALEQFFNQTNEAVQENSVPPFASKYQSNAPVHQMQDQGDGTYSITLEYGSGYDWKQSELIYDVPEGWTFQKDSRGVTFTCTTGNPDIGLVKGRFPEGSAGAKYWVRPNTFKVWYPEGWDASSAVEGKQAMITMAGKQEPWEVWLAFGKGGSGGNGGSGGGGSFDASEGGFEIPYTQYLHEETFKRDYKIELIKQCDETGKPLEGSAFEILEQFDFSQLDGTNLEISQFDQNLPAAEGAFHDMSVCQSMIVTDQNGHFEHSDKKLYQYEKTYCGGHPEPEITPIEVSADAKEEEKAAAAEANAALEEAAMEAWQSCVDWCEENCDFHSIDEGAARDEMEQDRDATWDTFIHLKRIYTVREIKARNGYILHDLHNDDIPVEIIEFASSQTEDDGIVIGSYQGNRGQSYAVKKGQDKGVKAASSKKERILLQSAATPSNGVMEEDLEEDCVWSHEQEPEDERRLSKATPNDALSDISVATPAEASVFMVMRSKRDMDGGSDEGGAWDWDGFQEESEVSPVSQSDYPADYTGYSYLVRDHRTEGELHINKRDLELFQNDPDNSYGMAQADATLEGAVYGLYAAEDIVHPDGKTGVVFEQGELVSIAATDKNGDASFVVITEVSDTSKNVKNLYEKNKENNGNVWIGRPLILGSYYVEEIARSEGYELSRTGKNLTESNRTGMPVVLEPAGSAHTDGFYHEVNEWDGRSYDFEVEYFDTDGYSIVLSGLPSDIGLYEVTREEIIEEQSVIVGTEKVEKKDEHGNVIYQTAEGGEYKLDPDGNKQIVLDSEGNPVLSDEPLRHTVSAVHRLDVYISEIVRENIGEPLLEDSADIDADYIISEAEAALSESGYKSGLSGAPWELLRLIGSTNKELIEEILEFCASESFWDAYEVENIFYEHGSWYAKIRYAYKALREHPVIFEKSTGRLVIKKEYGSGYYYVVYEADEYEREGYRFQVDSYIVDTERLEDGRLSLMKEYAPLYATYERGEYLLDQHGEKVPVFEAVPIYGSETVTRYEERFIPVSFTYEAETGRIQAMVDTSSVDFTDGKPDRRQYRLTTSKEIDTYRNAAVDIAVEQNALDSGSYIRYASLFYPGQMYIYEDDGTREAPILVLERVIKQAVKVTKDIALDSYEHNTYEIHRDPFTVLFGGYNGKQETKTLLGFYFKLYLRSDLEKTGVLDIRADGGYDYEKFFAEHPEYAEALALDWDDSRYDTDNNLKTVHADRGGGKDDYWGQSKMMPYGVYVMVEQQPTSVPQKHYKIDSPQEVEIPFVPMIDPDGTVHDKIPAKEYLYDAELTPEELTRRYHIRFNEETHIIYAHNHDGDFKVFKYGLEPDLIRSPQNDAVSGYYHFSSVSEDAGMLDQVYYETYYDRAGSLVDYGITMDSVDAMSGRSTAIDRKFAKALVPWSVLDPRIGEMINDSGDIGNRDAGLEDDGTFNFVAFSNKDFENELYSSKLRIEKIDSETGENIIHDGALFKIYAASRDIRGDGASGVTGSGKVLFDAAGIPVYDEDEQIFMQDDSGAEVGIFKAYSTVRDGEMEQEDGTVVTGDQCTGYIETYQPLGAGAYVLVEVKAPEGYVKSKPIAFMVYSDKVEYYAEGDAGKKQTAQRYQYIRPIGADGKMTTQDVHQILVENKPVKVKIHKIESRKESITYRVEGTEEQLSLRGDVDIQYLPNGKFAGFGYVTKRLSAGTSPKYVENATLTLYKGLKTRLMDDHEYENIEVKRNLFDSVVSIQAVSTGIDTDIRKTGTDASKRDVWDITDEALPAADVWYYDLEYDPTEYDAETGKLYGLDDWGNRICLLDPETGMAYVEDKNGEIIVWLLDEHGEKIISSSVEVICDEAGNPLINVDLSPVKDENGLPVYYSDGGVIYLENEWVTSSDDGGYMIQRLPQGAYILEETAAPLSEGYVQAMAQGILVEDTEELQSFTMENDYTKLEISKLDMTTKKEIEGAELTLYEAYRVYDDSDKGWHLEILTDSQGSPFIADQWISKEDKPHWIDHVMPGDYILRETLVPAEDGYVSASDVEVIIEETGSVQSAVMEDDHTAIEIFKLDGKTGQVLDNDHRATLGLYPAVLNEAGEPVYDADGKIRYEKDKLIISWETDDGSRVRKTAHDESIDGGHSFTAYDYEINTVPGMKNAFCHLTEHGSMRFEYLPIGKYVLVELEAPEGYMVSEPVYIIVQDVGKQDEIQTFYMYDEPLEVIMTKVNIAGGKEIAGATVSVYRAGERGELVKHQMKDSEGNLLYVTDQDGVHLRDEAGNLIPAMEYDDAYLIDTWISGSEGYYTRKDEKNETIPEGYEVGDLKPHYLKDPDAGDYFFVEQHTPFGYVRATELPFTILDTVSSQKVELVDELIMGQLEIIKADARDPMNLLSGAEFKFTNLDTNTATILITGDDGRAVSSAVPIGSVGKDGEVSLYHFAVQETGAPEGYLLDPEVTEFQFNVKTDRYKKLLYTHEASDEPNKVVISKKSLTTKEELPGASLEVRYVEKIVDQNGMISWIEGDVVDTWISETQPHEIECLKPGRYVLIETRAPEGYLEAESVYFTIKEDMTAEEIPFVEMFDDDTKTEIIKIDEETREPLCGARLQLISCDTDEILKEWTTDETGRIILTGIPAGTYQIRELQAPDGYQLLKEPVKITVSKDYALQTFKVANKKTHAVFEKRDNETLSFVQGAGLRLKDASGNVIAEWESGTEAHEIKGLLAGTYTLEESITPDGYLKPKESWEILITDAEGIQTFVLKNQMLKTEITKKDKDSGEVLPGASLKLIRMEDQSVVRKWISTSVPETFKGLKPGRYMVVEEKALDGYAITEPVAFVVAETEAEQEIMIENEKIMVRMEKVDSMTGGLLAGAHLELIKQPGTKEEAVVKTWVSGTNAEIITGLEAGNYMIREIKSPDGYAAMDDLTFQVKDNEAHQIVMIKNQPIMVSIKKVSGSTGNPLSGAVLQLVRNTDGAVIREWRSSETAEVFDKLMPGIYTIKEIMAPSGYRRMEPQEIKIEDTDSLQEFVVRNHRIQYDDDDDWAGPSAEYMEIHKVDGDTGMRLSGARIAIYHPDGRLYFEGMTGHSGSVRFKKPGAGTYKFKEIMPVEGYYHNPQEYSFTVLDNGTVTGILELPNYKKVTAEISKTDVTTSKELPGAKIEIYDEMLNPIFSGVSDEYGKVYFDVPEPGKYYFKEIAAPEGYDLNETVFTFTVFEDGQIIGDCTITDQKHYGWISASYTLERKGEGDVTIDRLLTLPKTGDESRLELYLLIGGVSLLGLIVSMVYSLKKWKRGTRLKLHLLFFLFVSAALLPAERSEAAEISPPLDAIYEEYQYHTDNPDSDEAEKFFEKELMRDGKRYRLSEIRTELLDETTTAETIVVPGSPFIKGKEETFRPAENISQDGRTYRLVETKLEAMMIPAHELEVKKEVLYENMEALDRVPSRITVDAVDESTGQELKVEAVAAGQIFSNVRWEDGFSFQATFHEYGLDGYLINDKVFFLESDTPDFKGYEAELLSLIGASEAHYKINDASWDGEPFEDKDGILCRRAMISGKKLVRDCHIVYEGVAVFNEENGVRYVSTYEAADSVKNQTEGYSMKAIGVYLPKKRPVGTIAALLSLSFAGGSGYWFLYRKKVKKQ